MFAATLYNLVMTVITATALWSARRDGRMRAWLLAILAVGTAAAVLSVLAANPFGMMRFFAYGLFGHVGLLSLAVATLLRRDKPRWAVLFSLAFLLLEAIASDAFLIEPHWLEVSRVRIASDKIEKPVRIVLLADLQTDEIGDYERSVIARIVAEKPDLILLAGDYIQESRDTIRRQLQGDLRRLLADAGFTAPLGCFAVRGNVDSADWPACFTGTAVTAVTKTQSLDLGELRVTCLSMQESFSPTANVATSDKFHIVVGHCPNFALGNIAADLLLAGHCHGGQVRLPLIGPLVTLSRVPRRWAAGVSQLAGGRTLIVSRGVGMERGDAPRLRFLCRPELVVIELQPSK